LHWGKEKTVKLQNITVVVIIIIGTTYIVMPKECSIGRKVELAGIKKWQSTCCNNELQQWMMLIFASSAAISDLLKFVKMLFNG